jgi:hypothetical protein
MQSLLAGADATFDYTIADGSVSASFIVTDENGDTVGSGPVPGFVPGAAKLSVTVPAAMNTLPEQVRANGYTLVIGTVRGYRKLDVKVVFENESTGGTLALPSNEYYFAPQESDLLKPGVNSFQTLVKAEMTALDMPNLPGWSGADRLTRVNAMIQARLNLDKLRYRYREMADDWQSYILPMFGVSSLVQLTQDQYKRLPLDFRFALERAQIIEADDLIGADPILIKRQQGIVSEKIGESSTQFASVRPAHNLVCARAIQTMSRFIAARVRMTRA